MQRTTLIASVTISSLLVAGIAWAGSAVLDDGLDAEPVTAATATPTDDPTPGDDATPDDSGTPDGSDTPDDSGTPDDARTPDDSPTPDDSASPGDDTPLASSVVATHPALEAGSITVEAEGLTVRLVEVVAADGWRQEVEAAEGLEVEVSFRRDGVRIDVKAEVDDGQLRFRVRDRRTDERTETYVSEDGTTSQGDDRDDSGSSDDDGRDDVADGDRDDDGRDDDDDDDDADDDDDDDEHDVDDDDDADDDD